MPRFPPDKPPSRKDYLRLLAIVLPFLVLHSAFKYFEKPEVPERTTITLINNGSDSTIIDVTGWDSLKFDSLRRTWFSKPTAEEDSMYKAYGLDKLDSIMNMPSDPLVDSLLKELDANNPREIPK